MHRVDTFIQDLKDEILKIKGKGLSNLSKVEIDMLMLLHDLHESSCDFIATHDEHEKRMDGADGMLGAMDNPRRRRR